MRYWLPYAYRELPAAVYNALYRLPPVFTASDFNSNEEKTASASYSGMPARSAIAAACASPDSRKRFNTFSSDGVKTTCFFSAPFMP